MNEAILPEISGADCHIANLEKTETYTPESNPATGSDNIPRRDSTFLVLSPVVSSTHPPQPTSLATSSPLSPSNVAATVVEPVKKERRSSSTSSTGPFNRRYLKLGPVHGGGDPGVADYVDIEEE